jgi:hypothetical protein
MPTKVVSVLFTHSILFASAFSTYAFIFQPIERFHNGET